MSDIIKKRHNLKMYFVLLLIVMIFVFLSSLIIADPPSPHNVKGRVFTNESNGVQNGIPVLINNTDTGDFVLTYTYAPDIPQLRGTYSTTIDGSDGHTIKVSSWNITHYGETEGILDPTTTNMDVILNITRGSEANVTIIEPSNNTIKNKSISFNVTANISIWGNNGIDCNATISFSNNNVINITSYENFTHQLGDIAWSEYKVTNWSVVGINDGVSNISVTARCGSDTRYFENKNTDYKYNITIMNLNPFITNMRVDQNINLLVGGNLTILCNASITDYNTAFDIKKVNATFYQQSVGSNSIEDNNYHYSNSSCTNVSSSYYQRNFSCGVEVAYYANNGIWECNITAEDYSNVTNFSNTSTLINELLAIDVSPIIIDYGNLEVSNISQNDFNVTIRNYGNIPFNMSLRAYAPNESLGYLNSSMTCDSGNISNAYQRYSIFNGSNHADMTRLNNETMIVKNLTLEQRTNDIMYGNDTNMTYWKLEVPPLTFGICNGTIIFGAIPDD